MRVLVTGGSGFVGSHLIKELKKEHEVINYDIKEGKDILDAEGLGKENADVVFHLAADPDVKSSINPEKCFKINVIGSYNVLEFARKNNAGIVFISSSTVYGNGTNFKEDSPLRPVSNYGASKAAVEMMIRSYHHSYGIKATIVRPANIYGEGSTHGVMFDFYNKLKKNPNELEILGNGLQRKSYIYISDAVSGIITAWENGKDFGIYNLSTDKTTSVNEIASLICRELGVNPFLKYTGGERGWVGDIPAISLNNEKLKSLGWKPRICLEEGIRRYINWLSKR